MSCHRNALGLLAFLVLLTLSSHETWAQTVVTACGTDVAAGGMNLKTALAAGGSIVIRCAGGSSTIAITDAHVLRRAVTLDGEGRVTIDGGDQWPLFVIPDARTRLVLRNLTVRRGRNPFLQHPGSTAPKGGIVSSRGPVELWNVRTQRTKEPYDVGSLLATQQSVFEDNTGEFVVRAVTADVVTSTFSNNQGTPLTYPAQRHDERPRATLERAEVSGNLQPIRWFGDLTIRNSRFTNNGGTQTTGGALHILDGAVTIHRSDFVNNRAAVGGAIHIAGGSIDVQRTAFDGNRAEQRGGALSVRSGSTGSIEVLLRYVKLRQNQAASDGGAIELEGHLRAGPILFAANAAGQFGGALHMPRGRAELTRAVFVDNRAGNAGGAIRSGATGHDRLQLGNALIARNHAPSGGGFSGRTLDLTNATVIANEGGGLALVPLPPGVSTPLGGLTLRNSILASNAGSNCAGSSSEATSDAGQNLQFPGTDCGSSIRTVDPFLDSMYVPYPGSPARFAGDLQVCTEHPLVSARDVYGSERATHQPCAIGAVEQDLERHAVRLLPRRRELPQKVREFLQFLRVLRPEHIP